MPNPAYNIIIHFRNKNSKKEKRKKSETTFISNISLVEMDKKERINTFLNHEVYNLKGFGQILRPYYNQINEKKRKKSAE